MTWRDRQVFDEAVDKAEEHLARVLPPGRTKPAKEDRDARAR